MIATPAKRSIGQIGRSSVSDESLGVAATVGSGACGSLGLERLNRSPAPRQPRRSRPARLGAWLDGGLARGLGSAVRRLGRGRSARPGSDPTFAKTESRHAAERWGRGPDQSDERQRGAGGQHRCEEAACPATDAIDARRRVLTGGSSCSGRCGCRSGISASAARSAPSSATVSVHRTQEATCSDSAESATASGSPEASAESRSSFGWFGISMPSVQTCSSDEEFPVLGEQLAKAKPPAMDP